MPFKQYLISFLATIQGHRAVVAGVTSMGNSMGVAGTQAKSFGAQLGMIAKRALITIPAWMLLRAVFMGIIRTIGNVIKANVGLEEQMARIKTVVSATSKTINQDLSQIRSKIIDVAVNTRVPLVQLAEVFYFLRTAGLDTNEALSAFESTVATIVGTGANAKEVTRGVVGIYNTMGKTLADNLSVAEKFQKINDILTFTYATQDVQMGELIQSYTKLAPFLPGLSDKFEDVVTTLGFLNTKMLRSGRAGRLTARSILQLTKNSTNLASILKITFDPNKPISFLETIRKIAKQMSDTNKLTAKQSQQIHEIFATRGGAPIRLLIDNWKEFEEVLNVAGESAEGFAQRMKAIREHTTKAQFARTANILAVLTNEFLDASTNGGTFADTLILVNKGLLFMREEIRGVGTWTGYTFNQISRLVLMLEVLSKYGPGKGLLESITKQDIGLKTIREFIDLNNKAITQAKKERELRKKLDGVEKAKNETLKEIKELNNHEITQLKTLGAHELDIVRVKLENLKASEDSIPPEKFKLELLKKQHDVVEAQTKFRRELVSTLQRAELDMASAIGLNEFQVLQIKEKQLNVNKEMIGTTQYIKQLMDIRIQQALTLTQAQEKQTNLASDLVRAYQKASGLEKGRIARFAELRAKTAEGFANVIRNSPADMELARENYSRLAELQQKEFDKIALARGPAEFRILAKAKIDTKPEVPTVLKEDFSKVIPQSFWDNWMINSTDALAKFKQDFGEIAKGLKLPTYIPGNSVGKVEDILKDVKLRLEVQKAGRQQGIEINIGDVTVNIPENLFDTTSEHIGATVEQRLRNLKEEVSKRLADQLRNKL